MSTSTDLDSTTPGATEWMESAPPTLANNLTILSPSQIELAKMLVEMGQSHLFQHWPDPGVDDHEKIAFFNQISLLNESYPGGLASYIKTARELLEDSRLGKNPFDGFTPSVPTGEKLTFGDDSFMNFEATGIKEAQKAAFVLVAGGLGERLGYNGIKLALPRETTTGKCFLHHYIESILALQDASSSYVEGNLVDAKYKFHSQVVQIGFNDNLYVANSLVDMYAKCGSIEEAHKMFESISCRDVVIWNSMISKYAHHGEADKSLKMFNAMTDEGIKPNPVTYLAVLSACSHVGIIEKGLQHFTAMSNIGIEPGTEHYAAVVSLLGRAGKLQEAYNFIQEMPIRPAAIVWRSLLSACWAAGNSELGIHAGEMAIQSDPCDSASYVLLSNILASEGKWADAKKVRERMDTSGTVKEPGCSWFESDNSVHVFVARDQVHKECDTIYSALNFLIMQIKETNDVRETAVVLTNE